VLNGACNTKKTILLHGKTTLYTFKAFFQDNPGKLAPRR